MELFGFIDKHSWIPGVFFGFANLSKKPPKGELLHFKTASKLLLNSAPNSKLSCTWEGNSIHHFEIIGLFFESVGSDEIENRTILIEPLDGDLLGAELQNYPRNEQWTLNKEGRQVSLTIGVLKPKERFTVALFMQHGSKDFILAESRSKLKIVRNEPAYDFSTYIGGFRNGYLMAGGGFLGISAVETAKSLWIAYTSHHALPVLIAFYFFNCFGYFAIANSLLGLAINVWLPEWRLHKKEMEEIKAIKAKHNV